MSTRGLCVDRLQSLPVVDFLSLGPVRLADTRSARALGLSHLDRGRAEGLMIPGCRSVHTFGMRFVLDLHWLDHKGNEIRLDRAVARNRLRWCLAAVAVVEVPAPQP